MQPNQQEQNQQPYVPPQVPPASSPPPQAQPLPYAAPDYLGLEPIADPTASRTRQRKKRILFISLFVLIVALVGAAFAGYWIVQQNEPQAKLYRALEAQMQTNYVKRVIRTEIASDKSEAVITTDVSHPSQPKSDMLVAVTKAGKVESRLQTVVLDSSRYAFDIKSAEKDVFPAELEQNQWYSAPFHAAGRKEVGYWVDYTESPFVLNSPQGLVPVGNFTASQRTQLLEYIRTHNMYSIQDIQTQDVNGAKLVGYTVRLDLDEINALNAQMVKILSLPQFFKLQKPYPMYQDAVLWVDESTGRLVKMTYTSGKSENVIDMKRTTEFTYPDQPQLTTPSGVKELAS